MTPRPTPYLTRRVAPGFALPTVLLLGLALTLAAHAALLLSTALLTSAVGEAQRSSAVTVLDARLAESIDRVAVAGDLAAPPPPGVQARRLTTELLRLRADSGVLRREAVVWVPDPAVRMAADAVGVRVGMAPDGLTRARIVSVAAPADPCPAGVTPPTSLRDAAPVVVGSGEGPLAFGPLRSRQLRRLLPPISVAPPPAPVAAFSSGTTNFGAGVWRGWFWVDGDVEVHPAATVVGRLVVSGDLVVAATARIDGRVASGGRLTIRPGGEIRVAPCAAYFVAATATWPPKQIHPLSHSR